MKLNKEVREYKEEEYLWAREGEDCWVELDVDNLPDRDGDVFIRAKLVAFDTEARTASVEYDDPEFSAVKDVHLTRIMKRDAKTYPELNDLVDLPILNDAELHQKIKDRFAALNIFTYIGPSLLIVNPFKYLPDQYKESLKKEFYDCILNPGSNRVRDKPPHVWAIAASAYLELYANKQNQACCISGESGAGKTVNTKTCMSFLTGMNDMFGGPAVQPGEYRIEDKILMCNPILEALGNAKTVRNDNSSRFGKYISLFMSNKLVVGASVESYLLEAIRVTTPNKSERNYHVFYQFLKGASEEEIKKFRLQRKPSTYTFLERSGCYDVPTVDDLAEYKDHEKSMKTLNLLGEWREAYWRIISCVLHISNIRYDDTNYNGSNACDIVTLEVLDDIANVMKVEKEILFDALTSRTSIVMGKEIVIYLDKQGCVAQSEAFGKDIYSKLFSWVIKYLNIALLPEAEKISGANPAKIYQKIGLLDIFGFEIFDINSIEQLCINFTNEKLHQLYVEYVFKLEVQTFIEEGLKQFLANLSFNDNQDVIDLLAHYDTKKFSVFNMIDDQTATMCKDLSIVDQFTTIHAKNPKMAFSKTKRNMFFIVHTARAVGYTIDGFCEKNKDEVPRTIIRCVLSSKAQRIVDIYCQKIKDTDEPIDYLGEAVKKKESFIGYKFRQQMEALMTELRSCQCSFMRCIKPNEQKSATVWTSSLVVLQIRYLGLLDSIKIRKESYPFRFTFKKFVQRYMELEPSVSSLTPSELDARNPDYVTLSKNILKNAIPKHTDKTQLVGKTKVFLKIEAYQNLEKVYEDAVKVKKDAILNLDKLLLEIKLRNRVVDIRRKGMIAVDIVKQLMFGVKAKQQAYRFRVIRKVALKLQENYRMQKGLRLARKKIQALRCIQSGMEASICQLKAREKIASAKKILKAYRNYKLGSSIRWYVELYNIIGRVAKRAVDISIYKEREGSARVIQKYAMGYIIRQRNAGIVEHIKRSKELFKYNRAMVIMRKFIAGRVARDRLKKVLNSASVIQAYFKMLWTREAYINMRRKACILQLYIRQWLARKRRRDWERAEFLKQEYMPFLRKCLTDQSRLYPVDSGMARKEIEEKGVYDFTEPKMHQPMVQIPPVDHTMVAKGRIHTEVVDLEYIKDVLLAYENSWSRGYQDSIMDIKKLKTDTRAIEVGLHHTTLAAANGRCYCWGLNNQYQLGIDKKHETMSVFRVLKGEERLRYVSAGDEHSLILTKDRAVFGFGNNDSGQLGLEHSNLTNKIEISPLLTKAKLRSLHSKRNENYGITEEGELLFWPVSPFDPSIGMLSMPNREPLNIISLGSDFAVAISESGMLYSFGRDNTFGQLGHGHTEPMLSLTHITHLSKERALHVSCGRSHTLVLTKNNKIFAWGEGSQGQLGLGDGMNHHTPTLVKLPLPSAKTVQVCASYHGSYAMVEEGVVFWWGRNSRIKQLLKPAVFRSMTDPELYPIQIRSSWSDTLSITYLEIADLRNVKDINIGQKQTYARVMSNKWNHMSNSQFELPYSNGYGTFISSKNYEMAPHELKRSKPDPLSDIMRYKKVYPFQENNRDSTSGLNRSVAVRLDFSSVTTNSPPRSKHQRASTMAGPELRQTPPRNHKRTASKEITSGRRDRSQSPKGPELTTKPVREVVLDHNSHTKAIYKSSVGLNLHKTRRDQEKTSPQKVKEMLKSPQRASKEKQFTTEELQSIKKTMKQLLLKPRAKWTKQEIELFTSASQEPMRELLKSLK